MDYLTRENRGKLSKEQILSHDKLNCGLNKNEAKGDLGL